ncbi:MAG: transposase [Legionellaceae bacterium]|nr:transposase [Legionellaceae bacterium]
MGKTVFGALNMRTSRVYWKQADKGNSQQFIMFLHQPHKANPDKKMMIILDNGPIHKSKKVQRFLQKH